MKKLALALSLVPSIALAHPGHDDVGVGGEPATHALITNPVIVLALCMAVAFAVNLVIKKVRK
jgi:hypothetical protein